MSLQLGTLGPTDSKIKYSVFYNISVLVFMYYTVCYFTGIFHAVIRQISVLFKGNKDSVFGILYERWKDRVVVEKPTVA